MVTNSEARRLQQSLSGWIIFLTLIFHAAPVHAGAPELTVANFDSTLAEKDGGIWLLEFYAPWCGHCKRLSPIWDEASDELAKDSIPVFMAKVDCTSHDKVCSRYDVNGYPSLKVLSSDGKILRPYKGGRTVDTIVEYAKRLAGPKITQLGSTKDLKDFIDAHEAAFVLYEPAVPEDGWEATKGAFEGAAGMHYDVANLAIAPEFSGDDLSIRVLQDGKGLQEDDGLGGRIVVYREKEGKALTSSINRTVEDVAHWINGHRFKMLPRIESSNYRDIGDRQKPLVIAVMRGRTPAPGAAPDAEKEYERMNEEDPFETIPINSEFLASMRGVAKEKEDDFAFGYLDGKRWHGYVTKYGISTRVLPRLLIMDVATEYYLPVPVDVKGHRATVDFLDKVKSGEVKMTRNLETLFKELATNYWHVAIVVLTLVVVLPIGYTLWSDVGPEAAKKEQ